MIWTTLAPQLGEQARNEASERVPPSSPFPLCQRRLGIRQPERHRHGSIELDSPRERGAGLLLLVDRGLQRAAATQHLDFRDALFGGVHGLAPHPEALVVQRVQDGAVF
jgi:hypothetical protein